MVRRTGIASYSQYSRLILPPDMEVLKLWEPILNLTTSPLPAISAQALWVVGTAVQNNPKSQTAVSPPLSPLYAELQHLLTEERCLWPQFLKHEPFPTIINALSSDKSTNEVRAKALYVLSGALRHNREAVVKFTEAKGWKALKAALEGTFVAPLLILIL